MSDSHAPIRVKDRDGDVVAKVLPDSEGTKFAVMFINDARIDGPYRDAAEAEQAAMAWIHACEAMAMWDDDV